MKNYCFDDLVKIVERLRSENGCPWDKEQTHESLKEFLIEESYEVVDAINKNNMSNLCEELGDVLLQVVLHAQIESEKNSFDISDVIKCVSEKMITRHPHVFSDVIVNSSDDVLDNWEQIKKNEKGFLSQADALRDIPHVLPALLRAYKVQKKAQNAGLVFPDINIVFDNLIKEIEVMRDTFFVEKEIKMEDIGDILFSVVSLSRFIKLNPEFILTNAIEKFINKFEIVEKAINSLENNS